MIGLLLALLFAVAVFLLVMRILDRRMRNIAAYEEWLAEQERVPDECDAWGP